MSALSDSDLERYARHIVIREVGGVGQVKLLKARVLVVGAGGLGSPLLLYLAAAGVGTLGICDDDAVSLSNLQRQIIHTTDNLDQLKTTSAKEKLHALNPGVRIITHPERLTVTNALEIISGYDLVADGSDNFATRFLLSDACYFARKPLVSAAVGQFDGQISTFKPYLKDKTGLPYPTYRCFIGQLPDRNAFPSCSELGILGAVPGVIGSLQAMEVLKEILEIGDSLAGRLLLYDALATRFYETKLSWDANNPLNGLAPEIDRLQPENYT